MKLALGISFDVVPYKEIHYCLVEINGNIQTVIHSGSKRHTGDLVARFEGVIEEVRRFCVSGEPDEIWMSERDGKILAEAVDPYMLLATAKGEGNSIFGIPLKIN